MDSQPVEKQNEISSLSPEQQEMLVALQAFMINYKDRVEQWYKAHAPNKPAPPVVWNEDTRDFVWLNRANRRANVRASRK